MKMTTHTCGELVLAPFAKKTGQQTQCRSGWRITREDHAGASTTVVTQSGRTQRVVSTRAGWRRRFARQLSTVKQRRTKTVESQVQVTGRNERTDAVLRERGLVLVVGTFAPPRNTPRFHDDGVAQSTQSLAPVSLEPPCMCACIVCKVVVEERPNTEYCDSAHASTREKPPSRHAGAKHVSVVMCALIQPCTRAKRYLRCPSAMFACRWAECCRVRCAACCQPDLARHHQSQTFSVIFVHHDQYYSSTIILNQ
jgi:hypothetical protein